MAEQEREHPTLHVIVDVKSYNVLRVNQEPQSPAPALREFLTSKQHEGWEVMGTAPHGAHILIVLRRPLPEGTRADRHEPETQHSRDGERGRGGACS